MSKISNKAMDNPYAGISDHQKYLSRIKKTLYYGKLPPMDMDCLSLPVTELAAELFSEVHRGKTLQRLHHYEAAQISRDTCISPCSLVLALLYLDRLKACNPEYLERMVPSELFLVSLMVSSKFVLDPASSEEVYMDEWAKSGDLTLKEMLKLEKEFLSAIDWKVFVSDCMFWKKLNDIEVALATKQGSARGFYTYTELELLLSRAVDLKSFLKCISHIAVQLLLTYVLGVLTIAVSIHLTSLIPGTILHHKAIMEKGSNVLVPINAFQDAPVMTENVVDDTNKTEIIEIECNQVYEDGCSHKCASRNPNPTYMLKTGIFLATIKPILDCWSNQSVDYSSGEDVHTQNRVDDNVQYIDWDWWTIPVMNWLNKVSGVFDNIEMVPSFNYISYIETSASNMKLIQLEDQIHKATKTRLQDQMETSWHKEWIDVLKVGLFVEKRDAYAVTNLKS